MATDRTLLSGVVTKDPLLDIAIGDTIAFSPWTFPPATFLEPKPWDCFKGVLLKLSFATKSRSRITGSAVMVAPGIAITARHVIEPEIAGLMAGKQSAYALALNDGAIDIWAVRHITAQPHTDLAILSLERASALPKVPLAQAVVASRLPNVGAPVLIAGFRAALDEFAVPEENDPIVGEVKLSLGLVTAHHPHGRDRAMLPWPCFEVNVVSWGGMSGGPVFNEDGALAGILCSSFAGDQDDTRGPSYVSAITPILTQPFRATWPPGLYSDGCTLMEARGRMCSIID